MDKVIELIVSWIQQNFKNPKLYAIFAAVIVVIALVFPYIDANFFFYNRIEKRVNILHSLSEIEKQRELSISNVISMEQTTSNIPLFKFLSGGALAWIITLCVPFMNTFKDKKTKVITFFSLALIGGILGGVAYIIPTIFNPWVNYIACPVLQLIILITLAMKSKQG